MGRQTNFYAGPHDIDRLTQELREKGAVVIGWDSPRPEPIIAELAPPMSDGRVSAWLARAEDLPQAVWDHYPKLGYWVTDQMASPAVQYLGSRVTGGTMDKGRLWLLSRTFRSMSQAPRLPALGGFPVKGAAQVIFEASEAARVFLHRFHRP